jgi:DNA uptake protein ComE-like DNA-binding protein
MKPRRPYRCTADRTQEGSVLVIVLMITIGMISISIYFANSMSLELRAADNRASGYAAEQAIEGASRYVASVLGSFGTNGMLPEVGEYVAEAVAVGVSTRPEENPRFWLVGRENGTQISNDPHFALVDEASRLDLNAPWLTADVLATNLPGMTYELAEAIIDWRSTNSSTDSSLNYAQLGYLPKHAPFESVSELRLLYGVDPEILAGEDLNRNGILDANEEDSNGNGIADPGLLDVFTVYTFEPNVRPDGTALTNVNQRANLYGLLESRLGAARAREITNNLVQPQNPNMTSLLQFYMRSRMTADEFGQVYYELTASTNQFTVGRVNVNTASAAVLSCLPGMNADVAQQLVSYRESNLVDYRSFAWIVDALGTGSSALQALAAGDYITARTFQVSADIAAIGPFGRGYRRARLVFDTSEGSPKVIYRQDLSRFGWALGRETRQTWVTGLAR